MFGGRFARMEEVMTKYLKAIAALLCACMLVPLHASAQSDKNFAEWNREISQHIEKRDFKAGLKTAEQALQSEERRLGKNHPLLLHFLRLQYQFQQELGEQEQAKAIARRITAIKERVIAQEDPEQLRILGQYLVRVGHFGDAATTYHTLAKVERARDDKGLGYADALTLSAEVDLKQREYRRAKESAGRALRLRSGLQGAEHHDLLPAMRILAGAHDGLGESKEAETLLKRIVKIEEQSHSPTHKSVVAAHQRLAEFYYKRQRYDEGLDQLLPIIRRIETRTLKHESMHGLLVLLAQLQLNKKNYPQSAAAVWQAFSLAVNPNAEEQERMVAFKQWLTLTHMLPPHGTTSIDGLAKALYDLETGRGQRPALTYLLRLEGVRRLAAASARSEHRAALQKLLEMRERHWPADDTERLAVMIALGDATADSNPARARAIYLVAAAHLKKLGRESDAAKVGEKVKRLPQR